MGCKHERDHPTSMDTTHAQHGSCSESNYKQFNFIIFRKKKIWSFYLRGSYKGQACSVVSNIIHFSHAKLVWSTKNIRISLRFELLKMIQFNSLKGDLIFDLRQWCRKCLTGEIVVNLKLWCKFEVELSIFNNVHSHYMLHCQVPA